MRESKVGAVCEKILEAGWLIAATVVPLFFNIYSQRVFEPDKLSILRSIALAMVAVWLIKLADEGLHLGKPFTQWLKETPLVIPTFLLAIVYLISTAASISPRISFWGSYQRLQGTYTTLSYLVIFFMTLLYLKRREQLERLITIVILTSIPISIYGIVQHLGKDPLPWGGDVTRRVASNMGNAIFVAAYLIMVFFLTLERVIRSMGLIVKEEGPRGTLEAIAGGVYLFALIVQIMCIFFSQSRGPWVGLLGGLYAFMLIVLVAMRNQAKPGPLTKDELGKAAAFSLISIPVGILPAYGLMAFLRKGFRWLWLSWVFHTILGILFLVVFNLPHTPLDPLKQLPYIGRLGQIFEIGGGTGKVRVLIWEGAVKLILPHQPLWSPTGGYDPLNALRPLIGYGPETMHYAYNPFYPPDLAHYEARTASPDRSHNETFDALVTTGLIGFFVYITLFGSIFYYGLRWLGFIPDERRKGLFLGSLASGGFLGLITPYLVERSFRFSGVGIPTGMIAGLTLYTMYFALAVHKEKEEPLDSRAMLLVALLATFIAHFIEIHFGIAIAATRTYFWLLLAVMVALGTRQIALEKPAPPPEPKRKKAHFTQPPPLEYHWPFALSLSLLMAFVLCTMLFDYTTNQLGKLDPISILVSSLMYRLSQGRPEVSLAMFWLFFFTWLVGGALIASRTALERRNPDFGTMVGAFLIYLAVTLTLPLIFGLYHASNLLPGRNVVNTITYYYATVFAFILLVGISLLGENPKPSPIALKPLASVPAFLLSLVILPLLIYATNLSIIKADIVYKQGFALDSMGRWAESSKLHSQAVQLAPAEDYFYLFLGRALLEHARTIQDPVKREAKLKEAEEVLIRARNLNPYNPDHTANLARLYRNWADLSPDPQKRQEFLQKSLDFYLQATRLSPNTAHLQNEKALIYLMLGQGDKALETIQHSLALDSLYDQTWLLLGDYYRMANQWEKAAEAYEKALEISPNLIQAYSALGFVYAQMGKLEKAVEANKKVLEFAPNDYVSHRNLALLYSQMGLTDQALAEAREALRLAPPSDKPMLENFISQLEQGGGK
jgi:tetratricopeptide (TPR) repeat protein/O-antigen ligase